MAKGETNKNNTPITNTNSSNTTNKSEKGIKKSSTKRKNTFKSYINKMIKQQDKNTNIYQGASYVLDNILKELRSDLLEQMFSFADKRYTLKKEDVEFATKNIFPGQLGRDALDYANEALIKFRASKAE